MCAVDTPPGKNISIHALREEGDATAGAGARNKANFYPRPPRGGRPVAAPKGRLYYLFLSTPSARRATINVHVTVIHNRISIHALREEGDTTTLLICQEVFLFLSTPSARRATSLPIRRCQNLRYFYPRPPRGGRRSGVRPDSAVPRYFYPRPPRGGRQLRSATLSSRSVFLSTPSARRATTTTLLICQEVFDFYPRPPRGGRPGEIRRKDRPVRISIHALREEGDATEIEVEILRRISIHALREEGDQKSRLKKVR